MRETSPGVGRLRWYVGRAVCAGVAFCAAALACSEPTRAAGWPTHRHDATRSGVTSEIVRPPLVEAWVHRAKYPPQPAWHGPARRDGWHKTENLKPRVIFDWAFHVVGADGAVYFGSSADDKVTCLDAKTGEERWRFFADGPIRLAPTVQGDKVYVGSDDGVVYCLATKDGKLVWKYRAAPTDYRVSGNERIMSVWPVRSGVVVDGGTAYFCAGLFAFEGAYLCAVNAQTGAEVWKQKLRTLCPQGYLLASAERLYMPAGGGPPAVFRRKDGKFLYSLEGSGGAFAVLSKEALIYGPGKVGTLEAFKTGSRDQLATFAGNQIVVTPKMSYLHTDTELTALDRSRYLALCDERNRLSRRVNTYKEQLKQQNKDIDYDPPNAFMIGTYKDDNEHYVFKGQIGEVRVWKIACDAAAIKADMGRTLDDKPEGLVGYWRMDEGTGEAVADSAGKNAGKLVKGPKWIQTGSEGPRPPSGQAMAFDGQTTYVDAGKGASLRMPRHVTIEAWIKAEEREKWSGIAGNIWDSGSTEAGVGLTLDDATGVWFGLKAGGKSMIYLSSGPDSIQLDRWHHVAGTYDGSVMKVYVDGVLKASKVLFPPDTATPEELTKKIAELSASISNITKQLPKCIRWKRACRYPYSLILASDVLFAGGTNEVAALGTTDGKTLWTNKVTGRALDLAVVDGRLIVSTDRGVIHCFCGK